MDDPDNPPPEGRGPENDPVQSPMASPADEPAADSDREGPDHRRTSYDMKEDSPPERPYPRSRSLSGSRSLEELGVDSDAYWRRNRDGDRSPSRDVSVRGEDDREPYREDFADEFRPCDEDREVAQADRSPTPVAPPPPKPETLNYKEKFLLKGHLRGVSAVKFSPDSSMIASGGMYWSGLCGGL